MSATTENVRGVLPLIDDEAGHRNARAATKRSCRHCGAGLIDERMRETGFCCSGCSYVYRLVHEHGLASYYQFKDETQQMILFGQGQSVSDLTSQILGEATKRDVPLDEEGVTVSREGARTVAEVAYTDSIELFPRYFYPVDFEFSAEAYGVAGASGARPRR